MKNHLLILAGVLASGSAVAATIPNVRSYFQNTVPSFLHSASLQNNIFTCNRTGERLGGRSRTDTGEEVIQFDSDYEKYEEIVWQEALTYLSSLARASTKSDQFCRNSDLAIYQTGSKDGNPESLCFMDREGMRTMVRQIQSWKIKMLLDNAFLCEKMPKTFIQSVVLCRLGLCRHRPLIGQQ